MKKIIVLMLGLVIMAPPAFADWKQYQKDERHSGWECDVTIDLPLCIKWRAYIGSTTHGAVPVADDEGYTYIIGGGRLQKVGILSGQVSWSKYVSYSNTSPMIDGARIIINDAYAFYAYDRNTGNLLWTQVIPDMTYATNMSSDLMNYYVNDPAPVLANGKIYIGTRAGKIIKLDSATGYVESQFQVASDIIVAPPAIDTDGTLYVGSNDGYFYAVNSTTGALKWKQYITCPLLGPASVDTNGVYFASSLGKIYRLNKATGAVMWTYLTTSWTNSGGALYNGVYYIGSDDRIVYAVDTVTGILKWKSAFTGDNFAKMSCIVICARVFILGCVNKLVTLDANTGSWDYTCNTQGSNFTSISYSNGTLLFTSNDGYLYAVGKCETACPCSCNGAKITPSATYTRTFSATMTPTFTQTFTVTPTFTVTQTVTQTATGTSTEVPTDTQTPSPTFTPSFTVTATPTIKSTASFSPTPSPTFTATACDGINPPKFTVKMVLDPENSNNIIFEITSNVALNAPPHITVYPHGTCANKPVLEFESILIPAETIKYRVLYPKQTGFGDIDKIIVKGTDLCGIGGISNGDFDKETIPGQDVKIFKNVFNPDLNERATVHYKVYAGDTLEIKVYSKTGTLVKTLLSNEAKQAGEYYVYWDGTNEHGQKVASGIYIVTVKCDYYTDKEKVSVIR